MSPQQDHQTDDQLARRLEELKRSRVLPGKYRTRSLLWGMLMLSILLATPRVLGWDYERFFIALGMLAFGLAPLIALVGGVFYAHVRTRLRLLLAAACLLLAIVPMLACIAWQDGAKDIPRMLLVTGLFFWLPQMVCITVVWFFLFRERRR